MFSVLRQQYPYYYQQERLPKLAFWLFWLVWFFLYAFQPFNVVFEEHRFSYYIICAIHSGIVTVIFTGFTSMLNLIFRVEHKESEWTLLKEILFFCCLFFFIGIANFLVRNLIYDNPYNLSWDYFFVEVVHTFLVGSLAASCLSIANFFRLLKKNRHSAMLFGLHKPDFRDTPVTVRIKTRSENEDFNLNLNNFLFAMADGNYVEFYSSESGNIKRELKRASLTQVTRQLEKFRYIVKTHRAFLVNANHIKQVKGNAQGLRLFFEDFEGNVPVSRYQIKTFDRVMKERG